MTLRPHEDLVADALRRSLDRPGAVRGVELPLVTCEPVSDPGLEVTPERAADLLLAEEAADASAP